MLFGNKKKALLVTLLALSAPAAYADDLKSMIIDAITKGQSDGYLDDSIARIFQVQTGSKSPIRLIAKRAETISDRCAKLEILVSQPDVPIEGKKTGTMLLGFKLPICTDGTYPEMLKSLDDARKQKELADCQQSIKKGSAKDGFIEATTEFKSCPKNGVVGVFYAGTCKDLNPGSNAPVKEFNFDDKGNLAIQMKMPKSCLASTNKWEAYLFERDNPRANKALIGHKPIKW